MSHQIVSIPDHGDRLTDDDRATAAFQLYLDDLTQKLNGTLLGDAVILESYTVAELTAATPDPATNTGGMVFVSDETGGSIPAFSDGTNWRRVTDRAVVT